MSSAPGPGIAPCHFYVAVQTFLGGLPKGRNELKQSASNETNPTNTGSPQGSGQNCLPALLSLNQLRVNFHGVSLAGGIRHLTQMTWLEWTIFFFSYLVPFPLKLGRNRARWHTASKVKDSEKFSQISQIKQNQCLLICHHGRHHKACTPHAYPWEHCISVKLGLAIFADELHEKGTDFCIE